MFLPANFEEIPTDALPDPVSTHLVHRAQRLGHTDIAKVTDFDRHLRLDVSGQYEIYGAVGDRTYGDSAHGQTEGTARFAGPRERHIGRTIFLVDILPGEVIAGCGEVGLSLTSQASYSKDKPLVLGTETYPGFDRQGYGHRRYLAMNAASLLVFGFPLHSRDASPLMRSSLATRRWEALVREGVAESYEEIDAGSEGLIQRYRFK